MNSISQRNCKTKLYTTASSNDLYYTIIVSLYVIIPVFTPTLDALDSNGTKFLAISLLNIVFWVLLIIREGKKLNPVSFFQNPLGLIYLIWLALSLLSFVKAWNVYESIVRFSQIFTGFSVTVILYMIFRIDKRYILQACYILLFILFIDCLVVYYNVYLYIDGRLLNIDRIKFVYSHKNILAAAIFIKLAIALWFYIYSRAIGRMISLAGLLFGFIALFFLAARAFLVGVVVLSVFYTAYSVMLYFKARQFQILRPLLYFFLALVSAFVFSTLIQKTRYPDIKSIYNVTVSERFATISPGDPSSALRIDAWKHSVLLIRQNPVLGVGLGNWKTSEITYDNLKSADSRYMYKAHNDFLEVTTETGIPGGAAYISLVFLPLFFLIRQSRENHDQVFMKYLFLSAAGLLCFSVDAFFNFPLSRPEIQMLFVLFLSLAISLSPGRFEVSPLYKKVLGKIFYIVVFLLSVLTVSFLCMIFISLRYQRIAESDIKYDQVTRSAGYMLNGFPFMPTISVNGDPIVCLKCIYLWNEKKYDQAIRMLQNDKSFPDNYARIFEALCFSYYRMGNYDSAVKYAIICAEMKPLYYEYTKNICRLLISKGEPEKAPAFLHNYLARKKNNPVAWIDLSLICFKLQETEKSFAALDSGLKYIPGDTSLLALRRKIERLSGKTNTE